MKPTQTQSSGYLRIVARGAPHPPATVWHPSGMTANSLRPSSPHPPFQAENMKNRPPARSATPTARSATPTARNFLATARKTCRSAYKTCRAAYKACRSAQQARPPARDQSPHLPGRRAPLQDYSPPPPGNPAPIRNAVYRSGILDCPDSIGTLYCRSWNRPPPIPTLLLPRYSITPQSCGSHNC